MLMSVYRHNDYDSEDLEEKLIKARYFHDLLHAVGRSDQIEPGFILQGFIHDKEHTQSRGRDIGHLPDIQLKPYITFAGRRIFHMPEGHISH